MWEDEAEGGNEDSCSPEAFSPVHGWNLTYNIKLFIEVLLKMIYYFISHICSVEVGVREDITVWNALSTLKYLIHSE